MLVSARVMKRLQGLILERLLLALSWMFVSGLFVPLICATGSDSLDFKISMQKAEYFDVQPIFVKCVLKNVSGRPVTISRISKISHNLGFHLERTGFGTVDPFATVTDCFGPKNTTLPPNDSLVEWVRLSAMYGTLLKDGSRIWHLQEGEYSLSVTYESKLVSNELKFSVLQPSGSAAEIVYLLRTIDNIWGIASNKSISFMIDDALRESVDDEYGVLLLELRAQLFRPKFAEADEDDLAEEQKSLQMLLDLYPDSPACEMTLYRVIAYTESDHRLPLLERLVKDHAGRNLGYFAGKMIDAKQYLRYPVLN